MHVHSTLAAAVLALATTAAAAPAPGMCSWTALTGVYGQPLDWEYLKEKCGIDKPDKRSAIAEAEAEAKPQLNLKYCVYPYSPIDNRYPRF